MAQIDTSQNGNYSGAGADALLILTALIPKFIGRGKNPPINTNRQILHTDGTDGKSQFRQGTNVENVVHDTWQNGTPRFNSNGDLIGKLKTYKDTVGTEGQKTVDVRFSKKHGIHGFPSNKIEGQ